MTYFCKQLTIWNKVEDTLLYYIGRGLSLLPKTKRQYKKPIFHR